MKKTIAMLMMSAISLSGCAVMNAIDASNERSQNRALDTIYPTHAERDAILKRAATEGVVDKNIIGHTWLQVSVDDKGRTYFVDPSVRTTKNTATSEVKVLDVDQSYKIVTYQFFCYQGYGRKLLGRSYTADHQKKFQLIGFGPGEDYDRRPYSSEEPYAKAICALGGFSRDAT
jgi:hypothetical protein